MGSYFSARSNRQFANNGLTQCIMTIENKIDSRVNVYIRKLSVQSDSIVANATVSPIFRTARATSITGGYIAQNEPFSTTANSSSSVEVRFTADDDNNLSCSVGNTIWQQFITRMHDLTGQVLSYDREMLLLPSIISAKKFAIRPGEAISVTVNSPTVAANSNAMTAYFSQCVWEEEAVSTFNIAGTVTLGGNPVDGAKVIIIEASDTSMSNPKLVEVITTGIAGTWTSSIKTGSVGAVFVQYRNGGTLYTAPGSPFLQG